jgi:hypothetical protein
MYILEKGLSYQRLILVVQEKPDYPVSETYPFTIFLTSLSLSHTHKNNHEGDPKIPIGDSLVPP